MTTTLTITGKPLGQPRQRISVVAGRARNYLPSDNPIHGFKYAIRAAWGLRPQIEGPVCMKVTAYFPRPKSRTKKRGPNPAYPHTGKPDADNVGKAVMDALNGLAYRDDSQVWVMIVVKRVTCGEKPPRTIVEVGVKDFSVDDVL